jgi:DNA-binding XRE family transcriptional regulator
MKEKVSLSKKCIAEVCKELVISTSEFAKYYFREFKRVQAQAGLTQEQFAAKLGMSSNHYAQVERGEEGLTLKRWEKISRVLSIEPYLLLVPQSHTTN